MTWRAGVDIGAAALIVSEPLPGGGPFIELESERGWLPSPSARLSLLGWKRIGTAGDDIDLAITAARLEGCPVELFGAAITLRPCLGVEGGAVFAEGGGDSGPDDHGGWAALAGHLRLGWALGRAVDLEAQLGAVAPLTRYTLVRRGAAALAERGEPLGLAGGIGAGLALP
ncbi:MAG TPA: hypothetical protein PLU22_05395 [Polyangiaceae bacterium]|nr:hypothetical protein [Polyangiaceae bacterium]